MTTVRAKTTINEIHKKKANSLKLNKRTKIHNAGSKWVRDYL